MMRESPLTQERGRSRKEAKAQSQESVPEEDFRLRQANKKPLADRGPFGVGHRVKFGDEKIGFKEFR